MKQSLLPQYYISRPNPAHIVTVFADLSKKKKRNLVIFGTFSKFQWREAFWSWIFCKFQSEMPDESLIFWSLARKRDLDNSGPFFSQRDKNMCSGSGLSGEPAVTWAVAFLSWCGRERWAGTEARLCVGVCRRWVSSKHVQRLWDG